jgi:hypothetical protein
VPDRPDSTAPATSACASPTTVRVVVEGRYGFESVLWMHGELWAPYIRLEAREDASAKLSGGQFMGTPGSPEAWVFEGGVLTGMPGGVLRLPSYPALAAAPEAFCSVETSASAVTVRCLDEQGLIDSRRLEAPAGCVDIVNDVGTRDLEPLRRNWQASASGCADGDASSTRVPVVLELTPARTAEPCALPTCRAMHVSVVAPGLRRSLGNLVGVDSTCAARHLDEPRGLSYGCNDDHLFAAVVYQVGRKLIYRVDASVFASAPQDSGAVAGLEDFDLPCGARADFQLRSFFTVKWAPE